MIQGDSEQCDEKEGSEGMERFFYRFYPRLLLAGMGHFPIA
jgi:hypothetical protein